MRYRTLGKTELKVSEVGFGTIPIMRLKDDARAIKVIRRAYQLGITFFDSARSYGNSEERLGKALRGKDCIIATKSSVQSRQEMAQDIDASLKALQRETIDLYQLHLVTDARDLRQRMAPEGALQALIQARKAGKIRHIGITGHCRQTLVKAVKKHEIFETVQVPFNYVEDEILDGLLPLCLKKDLGVIAMKPLGGGNITQAKLALKFILGYPISSAIPGMQSIKEVKENAAIGGGSLAISDQDKRALAKSRKELDKLSCRRCGYCLPCPQGIPINWLLMVRSMIKRMGAVRVVNQDLVKAAELAQGCVRCETCVKKCPYDLPIPDLLEKEVAWLHSLPEFRKKL